MSTTTAVLGLVKNADGDNARTALSTNLPANMDILESVLTGADAIKIPAAALAEAYMVKIAPDVSLGEDTATIDFANIPQGYRNLRLVVSGLLDGENSVGIRLNDIGTGDYHFQVADAHGTTLAASEGLDQTIGRIGRLPGAGSYGGIIDVLFANYTVNAYRKWVSIFGFASAKTTGTLNVGSVWGFLNSTAAITKITLMPSAGNLAGGLVASLYGMP